MATSDFLFLFYFGVNLLLAISYDYKHEGVFRIGVITFEVSISVKNSSVKPKFSEIADFIAHELEIKSSQASIDIHLVLVVLTEVLFVVIKSSQWLFLLLGSLAEFLVQRK